MKNKIVGESFVKLIVGIRGKKPICVSFGGTIEALIEDCPEYVIKALLDSLKQAKEQNEKTSKEQKVSKFRYSNGKLIKGGDIIEIDKNRYTVEWQENFKEFRLEYGNGSYKLTDSLARRSKKIRHQSEVWDLSDRATRCVYNSLV